jgi:hypothetical protein
MYSAKLVGTNDKALFPTPGLELVRSISSEGVGRKTFAFKDVTFFVVGQNIYVMDVLLNASFIGSISTSTGHVGIARLNNKIAFCDGVGYWVYDVNSSIFSQITAPFVPTAPQDIAVLAGRVVVLEKDTNILYFSDLNDASTFDALNKFEMKPYSDIGVGLSVLGGHLYVMGQNFTATYYDSGSYPLPYRQDAIPVEFGCAAIGSISSDLGYVAWLSRNSNGVSSIMMSDGGRVEPVSTQAIDKEIEGYEDISDGQSYIFKNELGHIFYVISFTSANATWQFHINSTLPLEERWSKLEYDAQDRILVQDHVYFGSRHYGIDYRNANLYQISTLFKNDAGKNIRRRRITKEIRLPTGDFFTLNKFKLEGKKGTGKASGEDSDPKVFISVSHDRGLTYGNVLSESLGKIGERNIDTEFFNLGYSRSFVIKIEHYNDTEFLITNAYINVSGEA